MMVLVSAVWMGVDVMMLLWAAGVEFDVETVGGIDRRWYMMILL